jgi:hypothetical protein
LDYFWHLHLLVRDLIYRKTKTFSSKKHKIFQKKFYLLLDFVVHLRYIRGGKISIILAIGKIINGIFSRMEGKK